MKFRRQNVRVVVARIRAILRSYIVNSVPSESPSEYSRSKRARVNPTRRRSDIHSHGIQTSSSSGIFALALSSSVSSRLSENNFTPRNLEQPPIFSHDFTILNPAATTIDSGRTKSFQVASEYFTTCLNRSQASLFCEHTPSQRAQIRFSSAAASRFSPVSPKDCSRESSTDAQFGKNPAAVVACLLGKPRGRQ